MQLFIGSVYLSLIDKNMNELKSPYLGESYLLFLYVQWLIECLFIWLISERTKDVMDYEQQLVYSGVSRPKT